MGLAVPGLGEEDGGDPVAGQMQAGFQAILHEEADLLFPEVMEFAVGIPRGHHPDILGRHCRQGALQPGPDGPGPVPGGDKQQGRLPGQAGEDRDCLGEGLHCQLVGAVNKFPDQFGNDPGLQIQTVLQGKRGDVLVAQMVAAVVALPGQGEEGGHDVGHHPVDVEGQGVQGDERQLVATYTIIVLLHRY